MMINMYMSERLENVCNRCAFRLFDFIIPLFERKVKES